jgi:fatty acid desaturase
MLRHSADYRTLLWLAFMPTVVAISYTHPTWALWLCPLGMYLAGAAGVIAHNHNHAGTFKNKRANAVMAAYLSIFYGYPTFGWIPTHNLNHHKFVNRPGDATITWRHSKSNNLFIAVSYFFVSAYYQSEPIKAYIKKARAGNPALFRQIVGQYVVWGGTYIALFSAGVAMHGLKTGALVFLFSMAIPALFSMWIIMTFNYMQHVHTDPWSDHNHSRNFVSPLFNFLMFGNGYHTAHHENAGTHWSKLADVHATFADKIDPSLNVQSFVWWMVKCWLLAPFFPSLGTTQIGRAAYDVGGGTEAKKLETADVDAVEAGLNADIVRTLDNSQRRQKRRDPKSGSRRFFWIHRKHGRREGLGGWDAAGGRAVDGSSPSCLPIFL